MSNLKSKFNKNIVTLKVSFIKQSSGIKLEPYTIY